MQAANRARLDSAAHTPDNESARRQCALGQRDHSDSQSTPNSRWIAGRRARISRPISEATGTRSRICEKYRRLHSALIARSFKHHSGAG